LKPSLRELSILNPVGLHSSPCARFAGFRITPLEGKSEPRAVALERVIVHHDPNVRPFLSDPGNFRRVGLACYGPVTGFVVPDVGRLDTLGDQAVLPSCQTRSHRSNKSLNITFADIAEFPCPCRQVAAGAAVQKVAKKIKQVLRFTI
jgi:hypothetical protein